MLLPSNKSAAAQPPSIPSANAAAPQTNHNTDKYSALADLESVFSSTSISGGGGSAFGGGGMPHGASVNWSGGGPIGGTSTMWGAPSGVPHSAFGGGAATAAPGFGAAGVASPLGMSPPSYSSVAAMQSGLYLHAADDTA